MDAGGSIFSAARRPPAQSLFYSGWEVASGAEPPPGIGYILRGTGGLVAASRLPHFLEAGSWARHLCYLSRLPYQVFIKSLGVQDTLYTCVPSEQRHRQLWDLWLSPAQECIIRAPHLYVLSEAALAGPSFTHGLTHHGVPGCCHGEPEAGH